MKSTVPNILPAPPSALRGGLISLALPTLLSSLGSSITNVSLPTLAQVFNASFQDVQWVVIAYLLAITTLIVGVGRLGISSAVARYYWPDSACLCSPRWVVLSLRPSGG